MSGWPLVPLGDIFEIARGGSPRPIQSFITDDPDGVNWIMIGDAAENSKYIYKTKKRIRKNGVIKSRMVYPGDFLLTNSMSFGHPYILKTTGCIHDGWLVLRNQSDNVDQDYFYHLLGSNIVYSEFQRRAAGAVVKNLNIALVKNVQIPLPPLKEQKRIAAILDKADTIRRKRRQAIKLADEFLRSVFFDIFGDIFNNPKNWTMETVESLCSKIVDCPHSTPKYSSGKTQYPCIRTSDLQNGFLEWSTTKYVDRIEYENRVRRHTPTSKDILYSREGERFGMAAMVEDSTKPCLGQRMMLFQAKPNKTEPEFLWYLLNTKGIYLQAKRLVGGSTSPHVNVGDIKKFKAFCPPIKLQKKFSRIVIRISKMRRKFQKMKIKKDLLFDSLSQRAFRGEL